MSDETKIETVFYDLELRSELFDRQIEGARQSLKKLTSERSADLRVTADTTGVDRATEKAAKQIKALPGGDQRPAIIRLTGDITKLETQLAEAKKRAAEVGATREGKPLVAKLDAQISAFEAKIATARQRVATLSNEAGSLKFDANTAQLGASLKQAQTALSRFSSDLGQKLEVGPAVAEATSKVDEFAGSFEVAGVSGTRVADKISQAFKSPATAVASVTAALLTLAGVATGAAAAFDTSFRSLQSALPSDTDVAGLGTLKQDIVDLTKVTPRTAESLTGVAAAIAKMGEADPAEVAANLRTLALVGDALNAEDLGPFADQLDLIGDAFGLTAEEARQAFVQIAAMTKGKIALEDLSGVLGRSATRMAALGISAQEAAAGMTVLVDAGVNSRQITTGLIDLLEKSGNAERAAREAAAAGKDGDAQALRIFADTVNETTIASRGLVGSLGDLYRNFDGNRTLFTAAGLSLNDYQIAQKAADATINGSTATVLSYAESLEKLGPAADVNRTSAAALSQVLKNELSAQLIDLGNVFLPTVNRGLQLLVDLLSKTRREAKDTAEAIPDARRLVDQGRTGAAVRRLQPTIARIQQSPGMLEGYSIEQLRDLQGVFRALQLGGDGSQGLTKALALVETRITALSGASAALVTASKPTADALRNTGITANEAAAKLTTARDAARALYTSFSDQAPADRAAQAIEAWALSAREANVPTAEIARTVALLQATFKAAADAKSAKAVAESIAELTSELAALEAEASGSALQALDVAFAKITTELEKKAAASREAATAADALGDSESAETLRKLAAGYREQVEVANRRREGLKDLARLSERVAAAQQIEARFTKAANAAYAESVPTLADVQRAESDLVRVRTVLQDLANDPKTDPAVRAEAQKQLSALVKEEATATAVVATETSTAAQHAIDLGVGIQSSAQAALSLVQLLGEGNTELAQMLSSVVSIGSGIGGLGSAAQKEGGFGKLFSSGAGIASALGPIGAIAGGVVSLVGAFGRQSEAAKQHAEALKKATEQFTANLGAFVRDIAEQDIGSFAEARNALAKRLGALLKEAVKAAGFDDSAFVDNLASADSLRAYLTVLREQLDAIFAAADPDTGAIDEASAARVSKLIDSIAALTVEAENAERALKARQARELQGAQDTLRLRELEAQGRSDEAAALREQLAAQKAIEQAIRDYAGSDGYQAYIDALRTIQRIELAAAEATRQRARAIALLNDTNDVLGGTAAQKLDRALGTFGALFDGLTGIANGLDLGSGDGLSGLQDRLRTLFAVIAQDGISDTEQPIVDAIKALLGNIEAALDVVDAPFAEAVNAFGEMVNTFGLSLAEQATGYARLYGQQFAGFAALLGDGFDVAALDGAGLASLKQRIGDAITAILSDGLITDAEAPYLQALQQFFGIIGGMITAATEDAEAASQRAEATRGRNASLDIALGDLSGADAFRANLGQYSAAFRELFSAVDLSTSDGVASAGEQLRTIRTQLESLTDAEVVARFGMTRDAVLDALLDVDGGLDQLGDGLRDLAAQQGDFLNDLNLQYLDATGQGLEAVTLQTELWAAQMLATAEALGLATDDIRTKIETIASKRIATAAQRLQDEAARATPTATDRGPGSTESTALSRWGSITTADAMSLNTVLSSMLVELRDVSRYAARMAGALDLLVAGSGIPALMVPSLPAGVGFAGTGGPQISIIVNVNGPIAGMTPAEAGQRIAEPLVTAINQALGRAAGIDRRGQGTMS
ncbi:phage tail tape measure protein [Gemmatimonas sp.]